MRVTCDALGVKQSIWMVGTAAYDMLDWHGHLLSAGVVPAAPSNERIANNPREINYRVKDRIEKHSDDVQLNQAIRYETYHREVASNELTNQSRVRYWDGFTGWSTIRAELPFKSCKSIEIRLNVYKLDY